MQLHKERSEKTEQQYLIDALSSSTHSDYDTA